MNAVNVNVFPKLQPCCANTRFDAEANNALWITFSQATADATPYFSPPLLQDLLELLESMKSTGVAWPSNGTMQPVHYAILRSAHPDYFSLGGDLTHFRECIRRGDKKSLHDYSSLCADMMYEWTTALSRQATTIALVQGRALGGGFEIALGADFIVAEEHSEFGFPEILFGLFPCTGGMSLLAQRIGAHAAERMMTDGRIYSAATLKDMGVVDEVCPKGQGETAVEKFIATHAKHRTARLMLQRSRRRIAPLDRNELRTVVDEWVETAMGLGKEELRVMEMLIQMQTQRSHAT
jgi:DSF synthase